MADPGRLSQYSHSPYSSSLPVITRTSSLSLMMSRAVSNPPALKLARKSASARSRCAPLISSSDTPWRRRNGWILLQRRQASPVHAEAGPRLLLGAERGEPGECRVRDGPRGSSGRPELEQSGHDAAVGRDALERLGEVSLPLFLQILLKPGRQLGGPGSPLTPESAAARSIPPGRHHRSMSSCRHYSRASGPLGSVLASGARSSRRKVRLIRSPVTLAWRGTPWT